MKTYKKVEMEAKNAPSGSYAAGCPEKNAWLELGYPKCKDCERSA